MIDKFTGSHIVEVGEEVPRSGFAELVYPWERQIDEDNDEFHCFVQYRDMGPERTVTGACRFWCELNNKTYTDYQINRFRVMYKRWDWLSRAESWDSHILEEEERLDRERKHTARNARIEIIDQASQLVKMGIEFMIENPVALRKISPRQLAEMMAIVNKEQRTEFGEASQISRTQIIDDPRPAPSINITNNNGISVDIESILSQMDPVKLAQIETILESTIQPNPVIEAGYREIPE